MPITKGKVKYIAKLSKLKLSEKELEKYPKQLSEILNYMDMLNEFDTEGVEPLINPIENENRLREDKIEKSIVKEEALKNSYERKNDFFSVPKVINKGKKKK